MKKYERTVNRHILKMRFLQECIHTCPACQECASRKSKKYQGFFNSSSAVAMWEIHFPYCHGCKY